MTDPEQQNQPSQPTDQAQTTPPIQPTPPVQEPAQPAAKAPPEVPNRLIQQVKNIGSPIPGKLEELKAFILECKRVLRVTKKPDKQEYTTIVKISAIGMALIGALGFIIFFAKEIL